MRLPPGAADLARRASERPLHTRGQRGVALGWVDRAGWPRPGKERLGIELEAPAVAMRGLPALEPHRASGRGAWAPLLAEGPAPTTLAGREVTLLPLNVAPWAFDDPGLLLLAPAEGG